VTDREPGPAPGGRAVPATTDGVRGRAPIRRRVVDAARRQRARPAARVLAGSLVGQGLVVAASPLVARLYGPADLGALAVVTALSSVVGAVAPLGLDRAIAVPRGEAASRLLVALAVASTTVVVVAATLVALSARHDLARWWGASVLVDAWWACPVTIAAVAFQRIVTAQLARRRDWPALARRSVLQGAGQVACTLVLAPLGGSLGLVLGLAAGRVAALAGSLPVRRRRRPGARPPTPDGGDRRRRAVPRIRLLLAVAARYRRFPLVTTWSSLLNVAGQQAPLLVLSALHGAPALGALALALRVLGAPVGMVADAVGLQVEGQVGAVARARTGGLAPALRRLLVPLALLALAGGTAAAVLSPPLFPVLFGQRWASAGTIAVLLAPAFAAQIVASPLSRLLPLLERQGLQLSWDALRLVATSGAIVAVSLGGADVTVAVAAWSAASVVSYAVLLVVVARSAAHADRAARGRLGA